MGGGLAGAEAAWAAAERGAEVTLHEMRPGRTTPAHRTGMLAELVCSNSLGSALPDRASGVLQEELRRLGSLLVACADEAAVPAGGALAVDRDAFAAMVTEAIAAHPRIRVVTEEVRHVPAPPAVVATGPLTSDALAQDLEVFLGHGHLYFYDALCPIVEADSIDMSVAYRASRYGRGEEAEGDYINCPLDRDAYRAFVAALVGAEAIELPGFEAKDRRFFEGCLPIEIMAARGEDALAYGPMRPVGLADPRTGVRPHAVVQLRRDNRAGTLYNLVGFQTNLKWGEQRRVLGMIPGLEEARWVRFGQMHRNTYLNAPRLLAATMVLRATPGLFFAGQLVGIEGYLGNVASGLLAGFNAARSARGGSGIVPPATTMMGALARYVAGADPRHFQPMKANFGLLPPLEEVPRGRRRRRQALAARALTDLDVFVAEADWHAMTVAA